MFACFQASLLGYFRDVLGFIWAITGIAELAALVHGAAVVVVIPHRQPHDVAHVQVQPTARAWPLAQFDK
jgi:hypothetical protein